MVFLLTVYLNDSQHRLTLVQLNGCEGKQYHAFMFDEKKYKFLREYITGLIIFADINLE